MLFTNNVSIQEVLFFPQMKPEKKNIALSEEEKNILKIIKTSPAEELIKIKNDSGLSNKKWDKAIKGLTKNKLVFVKKIDDKLFIELIE